MAATGSHPLHAYCGAAMAGWQQAQVMWHRLPEPLKAQTYRGCLCICLEIYMLRYLSPWIQCCLCSSGPCLLGNDTLVTYRIKEHHTPVLQHGQKTNPNQTESNRRAQSAFLLTTKCRGIRTLGVIFLACSLK